MAREWGGVKELGRGCWWLAGSGVRWWILAVGRKCRPGGACWWWGCAGRVPGAGAAGLLAFAPAGLMLGRRAGSPLGGVVGVVRARYDGGVG